MGLLIVIITSTLITLMLILHEIHFVKYKLRYTEENYIEKESLYRLQNDFPSKDISDLKIEIEKISDMLLDNQESNRYTYNIRQKAKNDYKLEEFRKEIPDSVEILNYKNGKLKAQVNYNLGQTEYILIMYMNILKRGIVFLNNYKTMKRVVN